MRWMLRLRALGALGVAVCVVAEYSLIGHASSSWSLVGGHMSEGRELPEAVVLNDGRVLAIGGDRLGAVSAAVDVYDPGTNSWAAPAASLLTARYFFTATVLQDERVQTIADAVSTIQANLRASFRDPSFTIPGGTPQAQLQALVRAVVQLSRECRQQLYRNLGGTRIGTTTDR